MSSWMKNAENHLENIEGGIRWNSVWFKHVPQCCLGCEGSSGWRLVWHVLAGTEILISSAARVEFLRGRRKVHQVKPWRGAFVSRCHEAWLRLQKYGFNRVLTKQTQGDPAMHGKKQLWDRQDFNFPPKCKNPYNFQNALLNNVAVGTGADRLASLAATKVALVQDTVMILALSVRRNTLSFTLRSAF